jgi:uncharacterized protein with HEPN domain
MKARDKYVYDYLTIDFSMVWKIAIEDIPIIEAFCRNLTKKFQIFKNVRNLVSLLSA